MMKKYWCLSIFFFPDRYWWSLWRCYIDCDQW